MKADKTNSGLQILLVVCLAGGLATLTPFSGASETSILGYRALCTFSPISTTLLFYGGLLVYGKIRRG